MKAPSRRSWMRGAAGGLLASSPPSLAQAQNSTTSTRTPRIKIGQIGVAHGHATKLEVYRRSEDYEVVGIVEPDERLQRQAMTRPVFQGVPWLTREQLLETPGIQAVLVETRVRDLLATAEACVKRGLHVHLDKPAGESLAHYRRILEEAKSKGLLVQMGYMYRYNPAVILLRDILKRGWLGEVFEVHAVMSKVLGAPERAAHAEYRGGMMFELGCHLIDLVVGLLGVPSRITPYSRHSSKRLDELRDNMLAVFEYPDAIATVKSTALEVEGFQRRHLVVCGTEGTFHIQPLDDPAVRVAFATRGDYKKGYQDITFPKFARYVADATDMARVIRGEKRADFSTTHDLAVQTAVLRASGLTTID